MTTTADATTAPPAPPTTLPVEVLTDEELSVLTSSTTVVVSPVLAAMPVEEAAVARRTAFRGLVARGIIDPPSAEALAQAATGAGAVGDAAVDLRVRNDVLSALTLRQGASAVVAVARTTSAGQDFWYAHLVEEIVLLEEVGTDGLHRFALGHGRDLAAMVRAAAVHPDAADAVGEPVELPAEPDSEAPAELVARLGDAYLRSDVLVVTRSGPEELPTLTGLFTGPRGSWSVTARPGSHRAFAHPETAASIAERVRGLVAVASDQQGGGAA